MQIEMSTFLTAASVSAILIPFVGLVRTVIRELFVTRLVIKDQGGKILQTITSDSIVRGDPEEMKKLSRDIHRRITDGKAAA